MSLIYNKQNPFLSNVKARYSLTKMGSKKNTQHIVLDLKDLVKQAGLSEGEKYQFIQLANKNWWNSLFKSDSTMFTGKLKVQLDLSPDLDPILQNKFLYLYRP